jgi:RNA polymerase sigma factor (sigma-70 family)
MGTSKAAEAADVDEELRAAFAARDKRQVVTLLMAQHGQRIFRYALVMTNDRSLAEEVRQQTFADAYRDFDQVAEVTSLRRWLYGIAHHRCLDAVQGQRRWYQRYKNEPPDDDAPADVDAADGADVVIDRGRWVAMLWKCVDKLKPAARASVLLRFGQDLRYDDVAAIAGARSSTVQRRVSRALPVLRRCLERKSRGGAR